MPTIRVAGPVIVEDSMVLLVKAGSDDFWKFSGGKKESCDRSDKKTATRETFEEIGLEIEFINAKPYKYTKQKEATIFELVHFLAKRKGRITGGSARQIMWIPLMLIEEMHSASQLAENVLPTLKHFGFLP